MKQFINRIFFLGALAALLFVSGCKKENSNTTITFTAPTEGQVLTNPDVAIAFTVTSITDLISSTVRILRLSDNTEVSLDVDNLAAGTKTFTYSDVFSSQPFLSGTPTNFRIEVVIIASDGTTKESSINFSVNYDPCAGVNCNAPNGECVDGSCVCTTGWEGADCSIPWSQKYVRTLDAASESCTTGSNTSYLNIAAPSNTSIVIEGLGDFASVATVTANLTSRTQFTIPAQTDAYGRDWVGFGTYNPPNFPLQIQYTVTFDDGTSSQCSVTSF